MDRREFFQAGLGAAFAAQLTSDALIAQAPPAGPATAAGITKKLKIDIDARNLQWLRTADEVAQATNEMGFAGVTLNLQPYPGHIDPAKAATDLPAFANTIRKHGLEVIAMSCPIMDADSPNAEAMISAAHSAGLTHYSWGTFQYAADQPLQAQLDALKPRVEKLAKLNEKYKMTGMYETVAGSENVGAAIWDFLSVLKNFNPAYIGFHYDLGEMTVAGGGGTWSINLRAAGPYISGVTLKDGIMETTFHVSGGGACGTSSTNPCPAAGRGGGGGGRGRGAAGASGAAGAAAGAGRGGAAAAGAGRGRGGAGGPGGAPPGGDEEEAVAAPGGAPGGGFGGGGGRGGAAGGSGGGGGRGGGGRGGGGGGRGGGGGVRGAVAAPPWKDRPVPLGTGMDSMSAMAPILKEIDFSGPVQVRAEYPIGGAEKGDDKLTLPREQVTGFMKRDLLAVRAAWTPSGLL